MFSFCADLRYTPLMTFAPPYHQAVVKAAILARVAGGETVKDVCRGDPALPCAESVSIWAREDLAFGAALVSARRRGDWVRRVAFGAGMAGPVLARGAAGGRG